MEKLTVMEQAFVNAFADLANQASLANEIDPQDRQRLSEIIPRFTPLILGRLCHTYYQMLCFDLQIIEEFQYLPLEEQIGAIMSYQPELKTAEEVISQVILVAHLTYYPMQVDPSIHAEIAELPTGERRNLPKPKSAKKKKSERFLKEEK